MIAVGALVALIAAAVQVTLERDALALFGRRGYRGILVVQVIASWLMGLLVPAVSLAVGASLTAGMIAGALMIAVGVVLDDAHRGLIHGHP